MIFCVVFGKYIQVFSASIDDDTNYKAHNDVPFNDNDDVDLPKNLPQKKLKFNNNTRNIRRWLYGGLLFNKSTGVVKMEDRYAWTITRHITTSHR